MASMPHALAALSLLALSGGASAYLPASGAFATSARTVPAAPARVCAHTDSRGTLVRGRGLRLGTPLHERTPLSQSLQHAHNLLASGRPPPPRT